MKPLPQQAKTDQHDKHNLKIALVHDWLRVNAGSEKVVSEILNVYNENEITVYTLFNHLDKQGKEEILHGKDAVVSWLQHFPKVYRNYRFLLPLMPAFIRKFHVKGYGLIISSSHAVAKGFRRDKTIPHICYCHTPMRYAWDLYDDYSMGSRSVKSFLYKHSIRYIRNWDFRSATNVDYFIANSENVKQRIKNNYKRDAKVIYPPVRVEKFTLSTAPRKNNYLCLGRFVPYKKIDKIIGAFKRMPDKKLLLIGDGYDSKHIRELLRHIPNITWLGYKNDEDLVRYMQQAKACLFAAKEDFGIMCVEVQACGTPVIALNNGGYRETVIDGVTGYFFEEQTEESIMQAVERFEQNPLCDHERIRAHAEKYNAERFRAELREYVNECMNDFNAKKSVRHE